LGGWLSKNGKANEIPLTTISLCSVS